MAEPIMTMSDAGTHLTTMGLALDSDGGIWQYQGTNGLVKIAQASPNAHLPGGLITTGLALDDDGNVWQYTGSGGMIKIADGGSVEPPEPPIEPDRPPPREIPSWVLTNQTTYAVPDTPKPPYLARTVDPTFRTLVTRISGDPGTPVLNVPGTTWGRLARHHYNSRQAWNCNQSLIYLIQNEDGETGARRLFLDGETYEPLFGPQNIPSGADTIWHHTDPNLMWYATRGELGMWDPRTGATMLTRNFGSEYTNAGFGPWKWEFDMAGDRVVISCTKGGERIAFAYEVSTDTKWPDIAASSLMDHAPGATSISTIGISPLGDYIVWVFSPDIVVTTTLDGTFVNTIPMNYISHGDMCLEGSGNNQVIVGRVNSSSLGLGPSGRIGRNRLRDGQFLQLTPGGWVSHTSTRALEVTGWLEGNKPRARWALGDAQLLYSGENPQYPPYNGELLQATLTGSTTFRICHHHNKSSADYDGQSHPSMSPDGLRAIFASSWGFDSENGNVRRPVSCYVADFRSVTQPNPSANTTPPSVSYAMGSGAVGSVIAANSGSWNPPATYTRQWYADRVRIAGATGTSYTTQESDVGKMISCAVTATTNVQNVAISNQIGPITPAEARRKK